MRHTHTHTHAHTEHIQRQINMRKIKRIVIKYSAIEERRKRRKKQGKRTRS